MYYFDTNKNIGKEIARIISGDDKGKKIYLCEKDDKKKIQKKRELNYEKYKTELKSFNPRERTKVLNLMEKAYNNDYDVDDILEENYKPLYKTIKNEEDKTSSFQLEDGKMMPVFFKDDKKFQCFYIVGACGSGKSTIALNLAEQYHKDFPNNEIILISKLDSDETLDKLKCIIRIPINSFIEQPPEINEEKDALFIFDDYESFPKNIYDKVIQFINDIVTMGRHNRLKIILCHHNVTNYKATRLTLSEATNFVVFGASASHSSLKYLFGTKLGLTNEQIKEIKSLKSRWVSVYVHYPNFILTETEVRLL
jgi:Cdc6-like AAA superfamily ATPase